MNSASIGGGTVGSVTTVDGSNASWQGVGTSDEADDVIWTRFGVDEWNEKVRARGDVRIGEWRSRGHVKRQSVRIHFAGGLFVVTKKAE